MNFYDKKHPAEILIGITLDLQINLSKTQSFILLFKLVLLSWGWQGGA